MKATSTLAPVLSVVVVSACAAARPPDAKVVDPSEVPVARDPRVEPAPEIDRFPAGPGVTLMKDDLEDAKASFDYRDSYDVQLAAARRRLGVEGTAITGGVAFRGVGPKNPTGPFDCFELAVLEKNRYAMVVQTDRRLCGLPYREDASKPYTGPGPRSTLARMRKIVDESKSLPPDTLEGMMRARLGEPDEPGGRTWSAIGPRDDEGPITCHVLSFDGQGRARIDKTRLADCGIAWPPPASAFMRDEKDVTPHVSATEEECRGRCSANDVCVVRRVAEKDAKIVERGDDVLAIRLDGRPSHIDVTTTCVPVPSQCAPVPTATCVFSPVPGRPTPLAAGCALPDTNDTSARYSRATNGLWTLTCNMRKKTR